MKFQKILSYVTLVIAALTLVLALSFCFGVMYDAQKYVSFKGANSINADALVNYSQKANDVLVIMAIVCILTAAFLFITATNKRRNYYVTNYVAIGILVVYALAFAIVMIIICVNCSNLADQINYVKWKELYEQTETSGAGTYFKNPRFYSESKATIILGIVLAVVLVIEIVAWVLNLVWKIKLMQGEKKLLAQDVHTEVA